MVKLNIDGSKKVKLNINGSKKFLKIINILNLIIYSISFIFSIFGLIYNSVYFMADYHNIDLVHNILIVSNDLNRDF